MDKKRLLTFALAFIVAMSAFAGSGLASPSAAKTKYKYKITKEGYCVYMVKVTSKKDPLIGFTGVCCDPNATADPGTGDKKNEGTATIKKGPLKHTRRDVQVAYYYGIYKDWHGSAKKKNGYTKRVLLTRMVQKLYDPKGWKETSHGKDKKLNKVIDSLIKAVPKNYAVPDAFQAYILDASTKGAQNLMVWKMIPTKFNLVKKSTGKAYSYAGIQYTVYKSDKTTVVGTLTCNANGTTNVLSTDRNGLPLGLGTYYAKEAETNVHYLKSNAWLSVTMDEKGTGTFYAKDTPDKAYVYVEKLVTAEAKAAGGYNLGGIVFDIYDASTNRPVAGSPLTTNSKGITPTIEVPTGTYYAKEQERTLSGKGLVYNPNQSTRATVSVGQTKKMTLTNDVEKGTVRVTKQITGITAPNSKLAGFNFTITNTKTGEKFTLGPTNNNGLATTLKNSKGKAVSGLFMGTYKIDETLTTAQKGAYLSKTTPKTFTVKPGVTNFNYTWQNEPTDSALIVRKELSPESDEGGSVAGFKFKLTKNGDSSTVFTGTTKEDGYIYEDKTGTKGFLKIPPGTYTLKEVLTNQQENEYTDITQQKTYTVPAGETVTDSAPWINLYETANVYDLAIKKRNIGPDSDPTDDFLFTVDLSAMDGGNPTYSVYSTDGYGEKTYSVGKKVITPSGGNAQVKVKLKHGDTLHLSRLPEGTKYNITEAKSEYNPSYQVTLKEGHIAKMSDSAKEGESLSTGEGTLVSLNGGHSVAYEFINNSPKHSRTNSIVVTKDVPDSQTPGETFNFSADIENLDDNGYYSVVKRGNNDYLLTATKNGARVTIEGTDTGVGGVPLTIVRSDGKIRTINTDENGNADFTSLGDWFQRQGNEFTISWLGEDVTIYREEPSEEAYAVFDSADGSLTIFRDRAGKYTNEQVVGTKTYFAGIEDIEGNTRPKWNAARYSITTVNITDKFAPKTARSMFACQNLVSINGLGNLDTSKVTDTSTMFSGCRNLTTLDVSNFDTSNVTDMSAMFYNCRNLTTLDLSSFDTSNVTDMINMFQLCVNLTTIYVDDNKWSISAVNTESSEMFLGCSNLVGGSGTAYNSSYTDKTRAKIDGGSSDPGYLTDIADYDPDGEAYAVLDSSDGSLVIFRDFPGKYTNGQTSGTKTYYAGIEDIEGNTAPKWSDENASITTVNITDTFAPKTAYCMFDDCSNLASINGLENMDTSNVANMSYMFCDCENLTTLDLSSLDTSNVTNMLAMFFGCSSLTTLDLSGLDTRNVANMSTVFYDCSSLTTLDLSKFDTNNVSKMNAMFRGCSSLTALDLSNFDTSNVSDMSYMFFDCSSLTTIYVDDNKWNTSAVTNSAAMFAFCSNLVGEKGTVFDNNIVDKTRAIVDDTPANPGYLTYKEYTPPDDPPNDHPNDGNEGDGGSTEAYAVFDSSDGSLTIFRDTPGKYTDGQTSGTKTYYAGIEDIEGNTNTKWYSERNSITTVNITDKFAPKTAYYMFYNCSNLASINGIKNMDTSNVTSMIGMFFHCQNLTTPDVSNFDTSNVTNMAGMFAYCPNLTALDVSNFDTGNVMGMGMMFYNCSSLTTLDLSNFDTSNVTSMGSMFDGCSSLTTIYVDGNKWNASAVSISDDMFVGCTSLVGEKGTVYDSNYVDKTRAIVDDAPDNPGYLTNKTDDPELVSHTGVASGYDITTFQAGNDGKAHVDFTVTPGEEVYILGLTENAEYTITEAGNRYTPSYLAQRIDTDESIIRLKSGEGDVNEDFTTKKQKFGSMGNTDMVDFTNTTDGFRLMVGKTSTVENDQTKFDYDVDLSGLNNPSYLAAIPGGGDASCYMTSSGEIVVVVSGTDYFANRACEGIPVRIIRPDGKGRVFYTEARTSSSGSISELDYLDWVSEGIEGSFEFKVEFLSKSMTCTYNVSE